MGENEDRARYILDLETFEVMTATIARCAKEAEIELYEVPFKTDPMFSWFSAQGSPASVVLSRGKVYTSLNEYAWTAYLEFNDVRLAINVMWSGKGEEKTAEVLAEEWWDRHLKAAFTIAAALRSDHWMPELPINDE